MTNINIEIAENTHKKIKLKAVLEDLTIKDYIIRALDDKFLRGKSE
jgi:hypothetical protein